MNFHKHLDRSGLQFCFPLKTGTVLASLLNRQHA